MAPSAGSAEAIVLEWIKQQNRPVNLQNVTDAMQKHNIKKTAIQKILDSLAVPSGGAEGGAQVTYKDYGKQRIYMVRQDTLSVLSGQDMETLKQRIAALQGEASLLKDECAALEREKGTLEASLTLPQMKEQILQLSRENEEMETRLVLLRGATGGISTEERRRVDCEHDKFVGVWKKRKRIFKAMWDTVTETFPGNIQQLKEDLGIETDEDAGCSLDQFQISDTAPRKQIKQTKQINSTKPKSTAPGLKRKLPSLDAPSVCLGKKVQKGKGASTGAGRGAAGGKAMKASSSGDKKKAKVEE